jgi:hypothetical protein
VRRSGYPSFKKAVLDGTISSDNFEIEGRTQDGSWEDVLVSPKFDMGPIDSLSF